MSHRMVVRLQIDLEPGGVWHVPKGAKCLGIEDVEWTPPPAPPLPKIREYIVAGNYKQFRDYLSTRPSWGEFIYVSESGQELMGAQRPTVRFIGTYNDRKDIFDIMAYIRTHGGNWFTA